MAPMISQSISNLPRGLRTRFAPSPTGYLHLGHVASAIYVWGIARKAGAEILLRIEDHDQGRVRPQYEESILEDLAWLGFHADIGVTSKAPSPYRQSDHWSRYEKALTKLGPDIYSCVCSRREILERNPLSSVSQELLYDGHCRGRKEGPNLRLTIDTRSVTFDDLCLGEQTQTPSEQCGDLLLRDREGQWTYNFAVAIDDKEEDISLIIRGQDILPSTGRQILLQEKLGAKSRPFYFHHPLIWADKDKKLSKRDSSTSIAQWRSGGLSAEDIIGKAAFQVGLRAKDEPLSAKDVEELF